jgi:hypothetical protein
MDITGRKTKQALEAMQGEFDGLKKAGEKQRKEFGRLRETNEQLRQKNKLQALIIDDITTAQKADSKTYAGNDYREYMKTIKEIAKKYDGEAEWGVLQTGNIIDVRSAFIIGQGVTVLPVDKKDKKSEEMKFINDFFAYNSLDREMAQEFAKEAEIEGCFLGHLVWNEKDQQVSVQFRSRVEKNYAVHHVPDDYSWYDSVAWTEEGSSKSTVLKEPEFIYARFGGRIHQPNKPIPKIGKCLTQVEALDKALRDWREINHLYVAPIPAIECADEKAAAAMNKATAGVNWKLRKMVVIAGKLVYVSPNLQGGNEALEKEIAANAKMVSGTTGTPLHFLGMPEFMGQGRATADSLMELVTASTSKERMIWIGTYSELIKKAMLLRNANVTTTPFDPSKYRVIIPYVTESVWNRIAEVFLPAYLADAISLETFLAQIPGIDADAEVELLEKRDADALERFNKKKAPAGEDEGEGDETDDEGEADKA